MNEASINAPQADAKDDVSSQSATIDLTDSSAVEDIEKESVDRRGWRRILTAAALILLPLIYFYPAVLGDITLAPGDGWTQIFGIRALIGQMIARGELPLWNPYVFSGMPLLASIQPGALYPPTWLFAILSPPAAMNWMVITTYHIALIGTYLYCRRIGANRTGSIIAGLAFAFGGYMSAHLGHTNRVAAAAWLPWVLLAIEQLYLSLRWRWVALGAVFIALQLFAGEPQMTFYTVLVAGAYGLFSLTLREERELRHRFLFGAVAMSICGALLSAIQLIPERELLQQGERADISYEYFSSFSFPPQHLLQQIFPYFFGGGGMYWGKWNTTEVAGYVGMLTMILGLIVLIGRRVERKRDHLAWFWAICAVVALALAFGSYLPFGIHRFLHTVPVYNLFRSSGRHLLEFDFALAVLAALGATWAARKDNPLARRVTLIGIGVMGAVVAFTAICYRYLADWFVMDLPVSANAKSFTNPELVVPVAFFVSGAIVLLFYVFRRGAVRHVAAALLVALTLMDVASFGFFYEWNIVPRDLPERQADAPTVKFIKERESDYSSFRFISHAAWPYDPNYETLNFPNVSIVRGLQSVNGYDPLFLYRYGEFAGKMGLDGIVRDPAAFGPSDQAFNMLNAKYLLYEREDLATARHFVEHQGIRFDDAPVDLTLAPGMHTRISTSGYATELAIISAMGRSNHIPDGAPVVSITIHTRDGRAIQHQILAGRDTSEWAWDRPDVRATIKHGRAPVIESFPASGFEGHRYLARYPFERAEVESIELKYEQPDADLTIMKASLFDAETGSSRPLDIIYLPPERWRKLAVFKDIEIYENQQVLPRAWFVRRAAQMPNEEVLRTIKSGRMKDGSTFDPAETVLFGREDYGSREIALPEIGDPTNAEVKITRHEPQRIELQTRNSQPGFLVLSEVYYRGWEAWIDGRRAPVERVNYALRGLAVPAGDHRVEFVFRAHSFRNGAAYTLLGVLLLLVGVSNTTRRGLTKVESRLAGPATRIWTSIRSKLKSSAARIPSVPESRLAALSGSRFVSITLVILLLVYGGFLLRYASYSVGGADSAGYGLIARSLLQGSIVQRVPELDRLGLPDELAKLFIPLANDYGPRPGTMTAFYPVGMPLHVAAGALIAGWNYGPFLVSPVCALLSLVLIYLLGLELGLSRGFSIAGAVMLAASPTFIYLALQPMSDVVATLWSLAAIWAALRSARRDGWAALAGAAFGMAFLVRPSSVLLLIPILFCLRLRPKTLLFFLLGGLPLAAIFFAYNATAYGHPLRTGYTAINLQSALKTTGFTTRFNYYLDSLTKTMGPWVLLGWLGVAADGKVPWRIRAMLITWFGGFLIFYSCYDVYDAWWYTRFLLPAYPAFILGALLTARDISGLLKNSVSESSRVWISRVVMVFLLIATFNTAKPQIKELEVLRIGKGESVYSESCRWADQALPEQSLVVSMQMSGALKFYTQRLVVRWDEVAPDQWQRLKEHAAERGYQWYALLHPHEIEEAQRRLPGQWVEVGAVRQVSLWRIEPVGKT
jgi:4-amino-4-deoxy-L-arabinose transferase-like glycosyltransferase